MHFGLTVNFVDLLDVALTCVIDLYCMQMSVQLKAAEDDNKSLQQALKSEIELRMQLEGTSVVYFCICVKCLWKI